MQDRRQISFILALVAGVFDLFSAFMMLAMSALMLGFIGFPGPEVGFIVALFGWLTLTSLVGGIACIVGAMKVRKATGQALRSAGTWCIVGGAVSGLGGNLLSAAGGIVAGVLVLGEPPAAAPA